MFIGTGIVPGTSHLLSRLLYIKKIFFFGLPKAMFGMYQIFHFSHEFNFLLWFAIDTVKVQEAEWLFNKRDLLLCYFIATFISFPIALLAPQVLYFRINMCVFFTYDKNYLWSLYVSYYFIFKCWTWYIYGQLKCFKCPYCIFMRVQSLL